MKIQFLKSGAAVAALFLAGCAVYVRDHPGLGHRRSVVAVSGPRLVLVAGTSIKYCPDEDEDIFFYSGHWYVFRGGVWHHSARHSGPWVVVGRGRLPQAFAHVPPGHFKHHSGKYHPVHEHHPGLAKGHDKDEDGEDDHKKKGKGKGHGKR